MARRLRAARTLAMALGAASAGAAHAQVPSPQIPEFVPAELTVTNPPGQPVITPEQARVVTNLIWVMREYSRALKQENWIPLIETGAAKELDHNWMQGRLRSWAAERAPRQAEEVSVVLSRQYQFPAFFIAHLNSGRAHEHRTLWAVPGVHQGHGGRPLAAGHRNLYPRLRQRAPRPPPPRRRGVCPGGASGDAARGQCSAGGCRVLAALVHGRDAPSRVAHCRDPRRHPAWTHSL